MVGTSEEPAGSNYFWKLALLMFLILLDLATLATGDYEFEAGASKVALAMVVLTFVAQGGVAFTFYMILSATFPYKVGLEGLLTSRLMKLLMIIVIYCLLSLFAGGMRVVLIRTEEMGPMELLTSPFYVAISSVTKVVAPIYYAMCLRAAFELGDPLYYSEDAWGKAAASLIAMRRPVRGG